MPTSSPASLVLDLRELAARESEQVEWKAEVADVADVVRTIVAFANDFSNLGGGYVVCGVQETVDEHGFQRMERIGLSAARLKEVEGRVLSMCRERVSPPLVPLTQEIETGLPDRRILVFVVAASPHPHCFRSQEDSGKYYIRTGRETREARNGLYLQLLVRKSAIPPWDQRVEPQATVADVDLVRFRDLLVRLGLWSEERTIEEYLAPDARISPMLPSFFVREPLTGVVRPRNFTLLLVGREQHWPQAHCILSIYPGVDRAEPVAQRHEIGGTILDQTRRLIEHMQAETTLIYDKTDLARPQVHKYPERALQEVVVNALVHRDYTAVHPVRVTIFSDRIEVLSPGGLPPSVSPAEFQSGRSWPVWRNQSLSWVFNKLGYAQAEGQGIRTVLRTLLEAGSPAPSLEARSDMVVCVIPAHPRYVALERAQARVAESTLSAEATRAVEGLLALGLDTEAIHTLRAMSEAHPEWSSQPWFSHLRSRAHLQRARSSLASAPGARKSQRSRRRLSAFEDVSAARQILEGALAAAPDADWGQRLRETLDLVQLVESGLGRQTRPRKARAASGS